MKALLAALVLLAASTALAVNFRLTFTDVHDASAGGGYNFWIRQGTETPWANVTPINLFVPPTTTPGIHEQQMLINLSPGPFECAISAYVTGQGEGPMSNVLSGTVPVPTLAATATSTATRTATATRTSTPRPTIPAPTFISF